MDTYSWIGNSPSPSQDQVNGTSPTHPAPGIPPYPTRKGCLGPAFILHATQGCTGRRGACVPGMKRSVSFTCQVNSWIDHAIRQPATAEFLQGNSSYGRVRACRYRAGEFSGAEYPEYQR